MIFNNCMESSTLFMKRDRISEGNTVREKKKAGLRDSAKNIIMTGNPTVF